MGMEEVKKNVMGQLKFLLCNDGATDDHFLLARASQDHQGVVKQV